MTKEKDEVKRQRLAELDRIMEGEIPPKQPEKQPENLEFFLLSRNLNLDPLRASRQVLAACLT